MTRIASFVGALGLLLGSLQAAPASAATTDYDSSFGNQGSVELPRGSMLVAPQGDKILVNDYTGMTRYTASGAVDTTFGALGHLARPEDMYLTFKGGAILGVGARDGHPAVQRFTPDGQPDVAFNGGRPVQTAHDGFATDAIAQGDRLVIFASKKSSAGEPAWQQRFSGVLTRVDRFGAVDRTFGVDGETPTSLVAPLPMPGCWAIGIDVIHPPSCIDWWTVGAAVVSGGLLQHGDGFLLAAYDWDTGNTFLKRIDSNGLVDPAFNPTPVTPSVMKVLSDHTILVMGGASGAITMQRLLSNGYPDPVFGPNGTRSIPVPQADSAWVTGFDQTPTGFTLTGRRTTGIMGDSFLIRTDRSFVLDSSYSASGFEFRPEELLSGLVVNSGRYVSVVTTYDGDKLVAYRTDIPSLLTNGLPTAEFTYSCGPLVDSYYRDCTFDASGSSDPDGDALFYMWRTDYQYDPYDNCIRKAWGVTGKRTQQAEGRIETASCEPSVILAVEDDHGAISQVSVPLDFSSSVSPSPSPSPSTSTAPSVTLTASASKEKGVTQVRLSWDDPTAFDVFRDGSKIAESISGGSFTDAPGTKGSKSLKYQVCRTSAPSECSNEVMVQT